MKLNRKYLLLKSKKIINLQNRQLIKFIKWADERAISMLVSCSTHTCAITERPNRNLKPDVVYDYNYAQKGRIYQIKYDHIINCLRKTIK